MVTAEQWREKAAQARTEAKRAKYLRLGEAAEVREGIINCTACALSRTRRRAVPFTGPVGQAELVLVGEAPGRNEELLGEPFVGRAGKLLDEILTEVGTAREKMFILNTVSCRPPANREPEQAEIVACSDHFDRQLTLSGAWVGVCIGGTALKVIRRKQGLTISTSRGTPFWARGMLWVATYHTAYVLRKPEKRGTLAKDFTLALQYARGVIPPPRPKAGHLHWSEEERQAGIGEALDRQGWAFLYSSVLNDHIVCAYEDQVGKVPTTLADLPLYTVEELVHLRVVTGGGGKEVSALKAVHTVKLALQGKVVI